MASITRTRGAGHRLRSAKGAELIEFALVLPVLLVVLGGILDMGFLFNNYAVITNAAREGARMAAVPGWVESDGVRSQDNVLVGDFDLADRYPPHRAVDAGAGHGRGGHGHGHNDHRSSFAVHL